MEADGCPWLWARRGDNAVLTVGDEGRGMSEETLVRLFQDGDGPNLLPGAGAGFGLRLAGPLPSCTAD